MFRQILITATLSFLCSLVTAQSIDGAWHIQNGTTEQVVIFIDGYFSHSTFDIKNKKFITTRGGNYTSKENKIFVVWQYDSEKAAEKTPAGTWLGTTSSFDTDFSDKILKTNISGTSANWQRMDKDDVPLAGVWRITHRKQSESLSEIPLRDRRTLKIITGKRFQWIAINIKTGEFAGTGGGTYTFKDGRYTENIEFFSRNNDRVGASLTFEGYIKDGQWHHSGNSSSGNPIYEIWGKLSE